MILIRIDKVLKLNLKDETINFKRYNKSLKIREVLDLIELKLDNRINQMEKKFLNILKKISQSALAIISGSSREKEFLGEFLN